jgi:hypothetical protein
MFASWLKLQATTGGASYDDCRDLSSRRKRRHGSDHKTDVYSADGCVQAAGRFTPTPKVQEESEDEGLVIVNTLVRAQGDGVEGAYVLIERRCNPKIDMPQSCYLLEQGRRNFPLRRE